MSASIARCSPGQGKQCTRDGALGRAFALRKFLVCRAMNQEPK